MRSQRTMPLDMDLTASYFSMVVLPVALILHFLMALLFWKAFEPRPTTGGAAYLLTHIAAQGIMLTLLGNPFMDVARYLLMLAISGSLILFVFNRYFWCPKCVALD